MIRQQYCQCVPCRYDQSRNFRMLNMDCLVLISDPAFLIYTDLNELFLGWIFVRVIQWPRSLVSLCLRLISFCEYPHWGAKKHSEGTILWGSLLCPDLNRHWLVWLYSIVLPIGQNRVKRWSVSNWFTASRQTGGVSSQVAAGTETAPPELPA